MAVLFAIIVLLTGAAYYFVQPFTSTAVVRLPESVKADKVAPQMIQKLTSDTLLRALSSECDSAKRQAKVRRVHAADLEISFRCGEADGAKRGATALLQNAMQFDVDSADRLVERPMAPIPTDSVTVLTPAPQVEPDGKKKREDLGVTAPIALPPRYADARPLQLDVIQEPSTPARRLFY